MTPNQITTLRVAMVLAAVALLGLARAGMVAHVVWAGIGALGLIVGAIALDALDGHLARRKGLATPLGAQIDILGDRVIENVLFTFFAVCGLTSLWVPVVFFIRGALSDFLRSLAARAGKTGFGKDSLQQTGWGRALVTSKASRGAYAALKCACFCYLGVEWTLERAGFAGAGGAEANGYTPLHLGGAILVGATVTFCLMRGLPVFWEGWRYLDVLAREAPQTAEQPEPARLRVARPRMPAALRREANAPAPAKIAARGLGLPQGVSAR